MVCPGWDLLVSKTAHTALYDSAARFDPPKCDEDTRVEVIAEIMSWIQSRDDPRRLLYMTGPAGAGKSAIQQTVAERCSSLGTLAASFVFAAADDSRNDALPVVATLAYQLALASPILRSTIITAISNDPHIFNRSIKKQMMTLIVNPAQRHRAAFETDEPPFAILIDGLDECVKEERQEELLTAIDECLLKSDSPFRLFIASRPELVIYNALQPAGFLYQSTLRIDLNEDYNPDSDIERYFRRRFWEIVQRSTDPRITASWPGQDVMDTLIMYASGQFIYAATVIRYLQEPRGSPVDRLETVLSSAPQSRLKPLATLDALYHKILTKARENYSAANSDGIDLLVILNASLDTAVTVHRDYDRIIYPTTSGPQSLLHDLRSLAEVRIELRAFGPQTESPLSRDTPILHLHHYTFREFLTRVDRAGELFVHPFDVGLYIVSCCWSHLDRVRPSVSERIADDLKGPESLSISCTWLLWWMVVVRFEEEKSLRRFMDLNLWEWLSLDAMPWSMEVHFCVFIPHREKLLRLHSEELADQFIYQISAWRDSSGILDVYRKLNVSGRLGNVCKKCGIFKDMDLEDPSNPSPWAAVYRFYSDPRHLGLLQVNVSYE
ncbi:hypothetical protein DFP72DRAFT_1013926 [Ephemerocybe angulata]|uniref:Nephrocystin 3-like N-terminal domain-containing protein n=1 Tax=Ephemerocybe angulata TaxID=980116 RepID=A0A8H6M0E4_9AGAR|nr:hypothetical protein DFP72DRAFT_1013926 [Tulosesus angulatus]